jgi:hypothetical protein
MVRVSRDRWPAILSGEQEQILMNAGFRYDGESGVLVHTTLRKVLSVEAAAERGAEELHDFVRKKNRPGQVQAIFDGESDTRQHEWLLKRYGW